MFLFAKHNISLWMDSCIKSYDDLFYYTIFVFSPSRPLLVNPFSFPLIILMEYLLDMMSNLPNNPNTTTKNKTTSKLYNWIQFMLPAGFA